MVGIDIDFARGKVATSKPERVRVQFTDRHGKPIQIDNPLVFAMNTLDRPDALLPELPKLVVPSVENVLPSPEQVGDAISGRVERALESLLPGSEEFRRAFEATAAQRLSGLRLPSSQDTSEVFRAHAITALGRYPFLTSEALGDRMAGLVEANLPDARTPTPDEAKRAFERASGDFFAFMLDKLNLPTVPELKRAAENMLADSWGQDRASIGLLQSQINAWLTKRQTQGGRNGIHRVRPETGKSYKGVAEAPPGKT